MPSAFSAGDAVQTPFGKGVIREVRNGGRLLVEVSGRALVVKEADISALVGKERRSASAERRTSEPDVASRPTSARAAAEVDLHGLTVEDAMGRVEQALNDALLADLPQVRFVHGRSGGRIRAALHKRLGEISSVRHFLVDPRNEGVTIVEL
jgi:DNA mismatch repair protein MutS2